MSTGTALPVAAGPQVRRYALDLARRHPRMLSVALVLHLLAALAGLAAPRLLGDLVEGVETGTTLAAVDRVGLLLAGFLVLQTLLTRWARYVSQVLGEQVLAELREDFVGNVLRLPLGTVESAGSGDLLTRTGRDTDQLAWSVRWALPEWTIAVITAVVTFAAALSVGWWVALPCLLGVPAAGCRACGGTSPAPRTATCARARRTPRSTPPSPRPSRACARSTPSGWGSGGSRPSTTPSPRRTPRSATPSTCAPCSSPAWSCPTCCPPWAPCSSAATSTPRARCRSATSRRRRSTCRCSSTRSTGSCPSSTSCSWARPRWRGCSASRRCPTTARRRGSIAAGEDLHAEGVRFSYVEGREVLHGVDLAVAPGERVAMVGPSGAGKSTLGRLLAGIHPPDAGSVRVGGAPLVELPLDELRGHVALVTQEHHVFAGTLRENLALALREEAGDPEILRALAAVDAEEWVALLPEGLDTLVGSGGLALGPSQAQQVALARLVLVDPHTLVLDEATSLIDPRAARHLERSLAAVLQGRTVIAIAHRLFSAHDADRVAVVEDGRIVELGSHDELVAAGGSYAALWRSWHGEEAPEVDQH